MNAEARLTSGVESSSLLEQSDRHLSYPSGRAARILVIDDDPSMNHMLLNYLEQHDMHVALASQRQDVVRQLVIGEPSAIILDLRLDQEDGLDLLREIRSRSDVPVIITTGHRREEIDRIVGLELGADDYITKPFWPAGATCAHPRRYPAPGGKSHCLATGSRSRPLPVRQLASRSSSATSDEFRR